MKHRAPTATQESARATPMDKLLRMWAAHGLSERLVLADAAMQCGEKLFIHTHKALDNGINRISKKTAHALWKLRIPFLIVRSGIIESITATAASSVMAQASFFKADEIVDEKQFDAYPSFQAYLKSRPKAPRGYIPDGYYVLRSVLQGDA